MASRARVVRVPAPALLGLAWALDAALHDVVLTADEYHSMADGLADSTAPSSGQTSLSDWVTAHGDTLGRHYFNELDLHFRRAP